MGPGPALGGGGRGRGRGAARQSAPAPTGPGARRFDVREDPVIKEVTKKVDDISMFSQPTCSSGSSPIESFAVSEPTKQGL